jgi:hypothetical protein
MLLKQGVFDVWLQYSKTILHFFKNAFHKKTYILQELFMCGNESAMFFFAKLASCQLASCAHASGYRIALMLH